MLAFGNIGEAKVLRIINIDYQELLMTYSVRLIG